MPGIKYQQHNGGEDADQAPSYQERRMFTKGRTAAVIGLLAVTSVASYNVLASDDSSQTGPVDRTAERQTEVRTADQAPKEPAAEPAPAPVVAKVERDKKQTPKKKEQLKHVETPRHQDVQEIGSAVQADSETPVHVVGGTETGGNNTYEEGVDMSMPQDYYRNVEMPAGEGDGTAPPPTQPKPAPQRGNGGVEYGSIPNHSGNGGAVYPYDMAPNGGSDGSTGGGAQAPNR